MMKLNNVLLACALGAGSLLGAAAPASAARVSVVTARPAATGRVVAGNRYYGTGYRATPIATVMAIAMVTAIPTALATALVLALATATVAEVMATLVEATDTRLIRPYMGVAHMWHLVPIGALIAAHIRAALRSLTYRSHRLTKALIVRD